MEGCVVCCKSNEDIISRITTVSSEWKEWNIQRIIEKHLWWWYLKPPSDNGTEQWICSQCWQELSSFHNFYISVEKEHKLYDNFLLSLIKRDNEETSLSIKLEEKHFGSESLTLENVAQMQKPKRERKKKNFLKPEHIEIVELPFVQVKHENEVNDIPGPSTIDISADILRDDEVCSIDWEQCFLKESEDISQEKYEEEETQNKELWNTKNKRKFKIKSKAITKYRKKYTKVKKEKESKVINTKSNLKSQSTKKNDEFIADNQYQLSCCICSVSLSNFKNLKDHFRKEHDTLGYAMCCNKKFYKRGVLVDHLNIHKDAEYFKCVQCNKSFSTRRSYEKHMKSHQAYESPQILFTCEKCPKSFSKKLVFDRHVLTHVPEEERNFQCDKCEKKFASEYLLTQHCTLTHSNKYDKICDICGKIIRDRFSFMRHMGEHNGEIPDKVECDICGAELTNKYRLNRHKKMMHTEENQKEQKCPYCSRVSPNLSAHRRHIKNAHTMERKHACNMCDKKFRWPLKLKEHLSTHTGEPLYTCAHCPRTFKSSANMHKHRKHWHRKEWEEARMKKEARVLAGKNFLKSLEATQNETISETITGENEF